MKFDVTSKIFEHAKSLRILHEDADIIVVDKPPGISTQPLPRGHNPESLASLLAKDYPEIRGIGGSDWGAVHRLDRETSGIVVFARTYEAYDFLRHEFSSHRVEKEYTALIEGTILKPGKIDWPIGPDPKSGKRVKVYKNRKEAIRNKAQEAVTFYEPVDIGVLKINIKTGRRHQIRIHLASSGHPIVGDTLYGGPAADRMYLHASHIRFCHPRHKRWVEITSSCPMERQGC